MRHSIPQSGEIWSSWSQIFAMAYLVLGKSSGIRSSSFIEICHGVRSHLAENGTVSRSWGSAVPRVSRCETTALPRVIIKRRKSVWGYRLRRFTWGSECSQWGGACGWSCRRRSSALAPAPAVHSEALAVPTLLTFPGPCASSPLCIESCWAHLIQPGLPVPGALSPSGKFVSL